MALLRLSESINLIVGALRGAPQKGSSAYFPATCQNSLLFGLNAIGYLGNASAQLYLPLRLDYTRATHQWNDFNEFITSYNAYYGSNQPTPLDTLSPTQFSHINYGTGLRLMTDGPVNFNFSFLMTYGGMQHQLLGEYANGIQTQVDFRVRDISSQVELGIGFGGVFFINGIMAGYFRNTRVDIGYIYQDGTYSVGNEYDLLSIHSSPTTSLDFGLGAGLKLGPVYIPVNVTFPNSFISDEGLLNYTDWDEQQIRWSDIPRDYQVWANDPANLDPETDLVRAESLRSMRVSIGFEFLIGSNSLQD